MSTLFAIGDYHWLHKNLPKFRTCYGKLSPEEMVERDIELHNQTVRRSDTVLYLGDMVLSQNALKYVQQLNGNKKILILGNHCTDKVAMIQLCSVFDEIHISIKKNKKLFTHFPINNESLCDNDNVHAHTHCNIIKKPNYLNVSVDALEWNNYHPVSMDQMNSRLKWQKENPIDFIKYADKIISTKI